MTNRYNIVIHTIVLTIISIVLFTIYTISNRNLSLNLSTTIYIIGMSLYGLFIMFNFIFHKNSFYGVSSFCMTFLFCEKGFYNYDNISLLINLFMFTILGFIIHVIKFKPHLYLGHFTPSTLFFIFAISLSGIGVKKYEDNCYVYNPWFMPFLVMGIGILIIILLNYFECSNESTLEDVSTYFKGFIILIGYEIIFYILTLDGGIKYYFETKFLNIGIGNANTVAIILQLTCPFMLYFSFKKNPFINTLFFYLNLFLIFLTVSRGAIITTFPIVFVLTIYYLIKNWKEYRINLVIHLSFFTVLVVGVISYFLKNKDVCNKFLELLFRGLDGLTGRIPLWMYVFDHWYYNPVFGIGIVSNSHWKLYWDTSFQFVHSTIFHTLWMSGIVGLLGLFVHLFDKYYYVIKNKKYTSLMLMFYLCAGLYGLFDVTYYNLHFTTYLLVIMYLYSSQIRRENNKLRKENLLCVV